jgi:hypothetical protein
LNPEQHSPADGVGQFHTTRWSAVLLAVQSQAPGSQAALAELCRIYWYPIYSFVRRRRFSPEDAQDLTQGKAPLSYEQVGDQLQVPVGSVKKLIFRFRKRYASVLREEVARTVSEPGEIDEEIHSLCEALIVTEGRLGP